MSFHKIAKAAAELKYETAIEVVREMEDHVVSFKEYVHELLQ